MASNGDFDRVVGLIDKSDSILITTHTRPDGDACGCLAAIADVLAGLDAGHSNQ